MALDPAQTAQDEFAKGKEKRFDIVNKLNHLEPPFPWKVIPFQPGTFSLSEINDPLDFSGRNIIFR